MKTFKTKEQSGNSTLGYFVMAAVAGALMSLTTGCGTLTGIREADLWGAKFTFAEGVDFHAGANSIDRVDNRRGIAPIKGQQPGKVPAAYGEKY